MSYPENQIKYPWMRLELVDHLQELADINSQKSTWETTSPDYRKSFDEIIHFLFDDTSIASDSLECVGVFLVSKREAEQLAALTELLDSLFKKYGTELPDIDYTKKPEWQYVADHAAMVLETLEQNSGELKED